MAAWYGGETMTSCPYSSYSYFDERARTYASCLVGGKRPLDTLQYVDFTDQHSDFRREKRRRLPGKDGNRILRPAFYVIREMGSMSPPYEYEKIITDPLPSASTPLHDEYQHGLLQWKVQPRRVMSDSASKGKPLNEASFSSGKPLCSTPMEKTSSGLSISSDELLEHESPLGDLDMLDDNLAAIQVERHFRGRVRHSTVERILKTIICPNSRGPEFEIDSAALESIFYAANEIFFGGCLRGRVRWDWSDDSSLQYHQRVLGTTALRRAAKDEGYETLIVLSQPLLRNKHYNRRLLISTFLHELIHSYMFVCCGPKARCCGGHTDGFQRIAKLIDQWAGPSRLFLTNMEADLGQFKQILLRTDEIHHNDYNRYQVRCSGDSPAVRADPECRRSAVRFQNQRTYM